MEKKIYICDRCGTELDVRDHIVIIRGNTETELMETVYDFCPSCAFGVRAELDEVLKPKKKPYKKPETIEATPKLAPCKRKTKVAELEKKEKKPDFGTVKALYQAGWSVKAIAEDIKASEEAVRKVVKEITK